MFVLHWTTSYVRIHDDDHHLHVYDEISQGHGQSGRASGVSHTSSSGPEPKSNGAKAIRLEDTTMNVLSPEFV